MRRCVGRSGCVKTTAIVLTTKKAEASLNVERRAEAAFLNLWTEEALSENTDQSIHSGTSGRDSPAGISTVRLELLKEGSREPKIIQEKKCGG